MEPDEPYDVTGPYDIEFVVNAFNSVDYVNYEKEEIKPKYTGNVVNFVEAHWRLRGSKCLKN